MTRKAKVLGLLLLGLAFLFAAQDAEAAQARKNGSSRAGSASSAAPSGAADEAQKTPEDRVLVLPFQINAPASMDRLNEELPSLVMQRLLAKGIAVVPEREVNALLAKERITSFNLQVARNLAIRLKAAAALYGSYSQLGEAFSIDARFVGAGGDDAAVKPLFVERQTSVELLPAVDELTTRVANEIKRRDLVAGVEVRGTKVLDSDVVLMRINTRKGDPLDIEAIDQEVKRIWDLGYFSDVSVTVEPRSDGLYLVYTVKEKPRIESIVVEGAKDVSSDDVLAAMSTKTGSVLNEKLLAEDLQKVTEVFRKDGYYLAQVGHRVDMRQGGTSAALVITVSEGNKLYIKKVVINGCEQLKESKVKDELVLTERGFLSWLTGTGVLKEELLERDSSAITAYYLNNGFMDVTVGAPKVDYADDGITVTFTVVEGPRYTVGKVTFAGELIDTDERLREVVKMDNVAEQKGYFSLATMQDDSKKLADYYAEFGYAFAEVTPRPEKREGGDHVADLTYTIEKKQKVYIRRAIIEGNTRTRDNVILRELRLTDGDMFMGSKLRRSTQRLNKLGYFEVAEAELVPTQNEEEVDLKVKVKEKSTGAIIAGVGYSTYSAFGISGTIQEKNLWGKGYTTSIQALFSGRRTAYTYSFTNPRYNDTNLTIGFDLYDWRDDYYDYRKHTTGGLLRFAYPVGEYTSFGWGYRLDNYKLYHFDEDASELLEPYRDEQRWSSVALARLIRDTTDHERPTTGTINRLAVEYGGGIMGGDDDFIKSTFEHQFYYSLREHHTLHFRGRVGGVFKNGSEEIPIFERFWMGGIDTVRGYNSKDIVPRDPKTGDRLGGTRMGFANFEYIWTFSPEVGLNLVPFFDIGFNLDDQQSYNFSDEIKKSFGAELRWRSPMGDLRFAYGIPLDEDRKGDKHGGRFEFSMGQFF